MTRASLGTFLSERVWPIVRVLALQLLLMIGIVGGLVAILVFTILVDQLHWLNIDFHGQTIETINPEGKIWGLGIIFTVNLLLTVVAWRLLERKRLSGMLWEFSRHQWKPLMWGLLAGLGEVLLVFGCMMLSGVVRPRWGLSTVSPGTAVMALGWVFASCIMGPLAEEALNRGYWFQNIKRGWGIVTATAVTSLLFGGLHLLNPNAEILGAVNIALSAILWVSGMLWFHSLWFPIGWHAAWNWAQFFVIGLPNSGISPSSMGLEGSTLLTSELTGSHWLTGGDFGMEASLFKTITLITALVGMFWLKKQRTSSSYDPEIQPPSPPLAAKRVLFVIQEHFNADEYGTPRATVEEKGAAIAVAASSLDVVTAYAERMEVQPDVTWHAVHATDYDAIVFVGGYPYDTDVPEMQRIARDAAAQGDVVVAAICNAAIAIGKAGVLEDKRVASLTYHPASELEKEGAILTDATVERDGLIITGNGPAASQQFGEAIAAALEE